MFCSHRVGGEPASLIISTQIAVDQRKATSNSQSDGGVAIEFQFPAVPIVSNPDLKFEIFNSYPFRWTLQRSVYHNVRFGTLGMALAGKLTVLLLKEHKPTLSGSGIKHKNSISLRTSA